MRSITINEEAQQPASTKLILQNAIADLEEEIQMKEKDQNKRKYRFVN